MSIEEWKECMTAYLAEAARENNWDLENLSNEQRRELLKDLRQRGITDRAQAKILIAKLLGISAAGIEKDLR